MRGHKQRHMRSKNIKSSRQEMMLADEYLECNFRPGWILQRGWKVVPVENGNHFKGWEIDGIVPAYTDRRIP